MITYIEQSIEKKHTTPPYVTDKLLEKAFVKNNLYIHGNINTSSGILFKKFMIIEDISNEESDIDISFRGTNNRYFIKLTKPAGITTNINFESYVNKLHAQVVILNTSSSGNILININNLNINPNQVIINACSYVIIDIVCIDRICSGTFELSYHVVDFNKLQNIDLPPGYFQDIAKTINIGSLIDTSTNFQNKHLLFSDYDFSYRKPTILEDYLFYIDVTKTSSVDITPVRQNISAIINISNSSTNLNLSLIKKTKRGFLTIINKTEHDMSVNNDIVVDSGFKNVYAYNPYTDRWVFIKASILSYETTVPLILGIQLVSGIAHYERITRSDGIRVV
jgi:hypothetical protein